MTKIGFNTRSEAKAEAVRLAEINNMDITLMVADLKGIEWEDEQAWGENLAYYVGDGELKEYTYLVAWAHDDTLED